MKEKILGLIEGEKGGLDALEITRKLFDNDTVDDLKSVQECLYELESEGLIVIGKANRYRKSDLIKGVVDMHMKGNAHVVVPGREEDIFIARPYMLNASHNDTVLVKIINEEENEGKIIKVINRNLGKNLAEVVVNNGKVSFSILSDEELPFNVVVDYDKNAPYVDGQIISLKYVRDIDRNNVLAKAGEVITHKNAPDSDIKIVASGEFGIRFGFSDEVLKEARNLPQILSLEDIESEISKGREDFRNEIIFTIDGCDTKDIDDAISVKFLPNGNYELGVHIADVTHFVHEDSELWKEAGVRGNSNYLAYSVEPMYPPELSNGICSLNPNVDRFTMSCIMEINPSGKVVSSRVVEGIINSRKQMNYDSVQKILDGEKAEGYETLDYILKDGESFEEVVMLNNMTLDEAYQYNERKEYVSGDVIKVPCDKILNNMHTLSKIIRSMKKRRGEIDFESNEIKFEFDENKFPIDVKLRVQREAEKLIEDFMIAANESVASEMFDAGFPYVYRVHDMPSPLKIQNFINYISLLGVQYKGKIDFDNISSMDVQKLNDFLKDTEKYSIFNKKLLRSMQKAVYSPENRGHFGIASPCYSHFTSPIRRFSDTMGHRIIKYCLIQNKYTEEFLDKWNGYIAYMSDHVSGTERNSEKCERAIDDMFAAKYMTNHVGEEYDAVIDSCLKDGFFVITDKYISGRVDVSTLEDRVYYDEDIEGYRGRGNKILYMIGDKVKVECIGAYPESREIDFKLVRKL